MPLCPAPRTSRTRRVLTVLCVLAVLFPAGAGFAAERENPAPSRPSEEVLRKKGTADQVLLDEQPDRAGRRRAPAADRSVRGASPETIVPWRHGFDFATIAAPVAPEEPAGEPLFHDVALPEGVETPENPHPAPPAEIHEPIADLPGTVPTTFAAVAGQPLALPGPTRGIGFHESGSGSALPLDPLGFPTANLNAPKIELPPAAEGPHYLVMPTRHRPHGATTAVDLRMDHGVPVTSPVDGTVETVADYPLYGRFPDQLLEIVPTGRPDLLVRVLHVEGVVVEAGQVVTSADTVIAHTTRQLPFGSQVDRYAGEGPHVHIEVIHRPEHMPVEQPLD